jgi:OOP family OmpA-OmpF porin
MAIRARIRRASDVYGTRVFGVSLSIVVSLCAAGFCAPRAAGQDVQRFYPALDDAGFLGVEGTRTPGSWRGSLSAFTDWAAHPVELDTPSGRVAAVQTRLLLHLGGELGLGGRGAIAVRVPLIAYQDGPFHTSSAQVFTLVDPQLWLRYRLVGADMDKEDEPHDGPGLTVQGGVSLPLGKHAQVTTADVMLPVPVAGRAFAGDGAARGDIALLGDFQLLGAGVALNLGYRHHFWNTKSVAASATGASEEFVFGAALKVPVPPLPMIAGVLELRGVSGFQRAADTALELDAGLRWHVAAWVFVLGGGAGLTRGVGAPDGRVFLGAYFVPPRNDSDHDGVKDADDACPYLAEDRDGFQDDDGCPDPDNDGDMVPDLDDKCPKQTAEEGHDDDEDGCTDPA